MELVFPLPLHTHVRWCVLTPIKGISEFFLTNLDLATAFEVPKFELSKPFSPLQQLLGVLPPASRNFLPPAYRILMMDQSSPMNSYYPLDFEIDMNGKKNSWEGIVVIPYVVFFFFGDIFLFSEFYFWLEKEDEP